MLPAGPRARALPAAPELAGDSLVRGCAAEASWEYDFLTLRLPGCRPIPGFPDSCLGRADLWDTADVFSEGSTAPTISVTSRSGDAPLAPRGFDRWLADMQHDGRENTSRSGDGL